MCYGITTGAIFYVQNTLFSVCFWQEKGWQSATLVFGTFKHPDATSLHTYGYGKVTERVPAAFINPRPATFGLALLELLYTVTLQNSRYIDSKRSTLHTSFRACLGC